MTARAREKFDWVGLATWLLAALMLVGILSAVVAIRLAIAGGRWGCVLAQDPALCATIERLGQ